MVPNLKFVGHSTEIIGQSKIRGPLAANFEPCPILSVSHCTITKTIEIVKPFLLCNTGVE